MEKKGYMYLMANSSGSVIYTGVTSDLIKRVYEHKNKLVKGFTEKYNVNNLVYYEVFDNLMDAIAREKQIKAGSREKKRQLIKSMNPGQKDLYADICL
jgi:putative endonuclease